MKVKDLKKLLNEYDDEILVTVEWPDLSSATPRMFPYIKNCKTERSIYIKTGERCTMLVLGVYGWDKDKANICRIKEYFEFLHRDLEYEIKEINLTDREETANYSTALNELISIMKQAKEAYIKYDDARSKYLNVSEEAKELMGYKFDAEKWIKQL